MRGRPGPIRGTRIASSTASSWVLSWLWPPVRTNESGLPFPSHERCSLVEKPPLLRPSASSGGFRSPFLRPLGSSGAGLPPRAGALGPRWSPRSPPIRPRPPHPSGFAPSKATPPRSRRVANARSARSRFAKGRNARGSLAREHRSSTSRGCRSRLDGDLAIAYHARRSRAEEEISAPTPSP